MERSSNLYAGPVVVMSLVVMVLLSGCVTHGPSDSEIVAETGASWGRDGIISEGALRQAKTLVIYVAHDVPTAHANEGKIEWGWTVLGKLLGTATWPFLFRGHIIFDFGWVQRSFTDREFEDQMSALYAKMSLDPEARIRKAITDCLNNRLNNRYSFSWRSLEHKECIPIGLPGLDGEYCILLPAELSVEPDAIYCFVTLRHIFTDTGPGDTFTEEHLRLESSGAIAFCTPEQWRRFASKISKQPHALPRFLPAQLSSQATKFDPWSQEHQVAITDPRLVSKDALEGFCIAPLVFSSGEERKEKRWLESELLDKEMRSVQDRAAQPICTKTYRFLRAQTWPELRSFVKVADWIILCETQVKDGRRVFEIVEEWKGTYSWRSLVPENSRSLERRFAKTEKGFLPYIYWQRWHSGRELTDGQLVIFVHQKNANMDLKSIDVRDGKVIYAEKDWEQATEYTLHDFKKAVLEAVGDVKNGGAE